MTVHPIGQAILATDLCSCGKPIADHKCPSSQGYAPRAPKTAVCRACGQKAHQNIDGVTVRLECLWRQFAAASGTLTTQNGAYTRVKLPTPDATSIAAFAQWVAQGSGARDVADPSQMVAPDTAAVLKRMAARADGAAPLPDAQPFQQDVADIVAAHETIPHDMTVEEALQHPTTCDDGCGPLPTITLDTEIVAPPIGQPAPQEDYSDLF
jgi:hypothetical protein